MNNNEKLYFDTLVLETTRKCNLKCEHCCRGNSQDLTITDEMIDKTFNQTEAARGILLCKEISMLSKLESIKNFPSSSVSKDDKKRIEFIEYFMMLKREGMQEVHGLFPDLDYDDVVTATNAMLNFKTQGQFSMVLGTVFTEYENYVFDAKRENEIWERLRKKQGMKGMSRLLRWLIE